MTKSNCRKIFSRNNDLCLKLKNNQYANQEKNNKKVK